jgi:predicted  nucleic acid-binding Zn-ribbon protein
MEKINNYELYLELKTYLRDNKVPDKVKELFNKLTVEISEQDDEIINLENELEDANSLNASLESELKNLKEKINNIQKAVSNFNEEVIEQFSYNATATNMTEKWQTIINSLK